MSQLRRRKPLSPAERERARVLKARGHVFVQNPSGKIALASKPPLYKQTPEFVKVKFTKTEDPNLLQRGLEGAMVGVGAGMALPSLYQPFSTKAAAAAATRSPLKNAGIGGVVAIGKQVYDTYTAKKPKIYKVPRGDGGTEAGTHIVTDDEEASIPTATVHETQKSFEERSGWKPTTLRRRKIKKTGGKRKTRRKRKRRKKTRRKRKHKTKRKN